ncbi:MAG TPA: hypothetical protein DIC52_22490 [Candidatus Latescibacteria bacterium]|nr:hypothetical protein [Candidatus Latescibacterota bacterium]
MQGAGEIDDQVRQSTDAELVGKTLDGDPTAYAELVARHQNSVFALLSSRLRDRSALEDLAQEALLEAYTHLRSLGTRLCFGPGWWGSQSTSPVAGCVRLDQRRRGWLSSRMRAICRMRVMCRRHWTNWRDRKSLMLCGRLWTNCQSARARPSAALCRWAERP